MSSSTDLVDRLRAIVGRRNVLTSPRQTSAFLSGYRVGGGPAAAVVRPGSLVELWRVVLACIAADHIVIAQAANTGLTGGSTPFGEYDRPTVVINTLRISAIIPVRNGEQVVCLAGATLHQLERVLEPHGREPHSVIGSSCLGASVVGGVCNSSGGALVSRGPAYTEYALFAQADADGAVQLRNNLGIELGEDPETVLARLDRGEIPESTIRDPRSASARDYERVVRDVNASSPARFNADPARLYEASGCAGKLIVFAVRLDTFAREDRPVTFYIGTNEPSALSRLRRKMLSECAVLPISAEYVHGEAFDMAARYGKDIAIALRLLGTPRLPRLFALKARVDHLAKRLRLLPANLSDRVLQIVSRIFPDQLPARLRQFRQRFDHHLILKISAVGEREVRAIVDEVFEQAGDWFECSPDEAEAAFRHRFAVAGAAVRYAALHRDKVEELIALDVALRRDDDAWHEALPPEMAGAVVSSAYYGHFFCHVFHRDYLVRKGQDVSAIKNTLMTALDNRGAKCPAEHNVGHLYPAEPDLAAHYRKLDPGNRLNPGIGMTSRLFGWRPAPADVTAALSEPEERL
ncbi:MAG: D-lactate dehydrogenase [Novosphingobium sp.]